MSMSEDECTNFDEQTTVHKTKGDELFTLMLKEAVRFCNSDLEGREGDSLSFKDALYA